jgi:hypothetical protein
MSECGVRLLRLISRSLPLALIRAMRIGAVLVLGVHLARAAAHGNHRLWWYTTWRDHLRLCPLTGDTGRLYGEAWKRLRVFRTPRGALDRLAMGRVRRGLALSPQPRADHAQPQQSEPQEVVKQPVVYHLVPLHACPVNGGISLLFQARELSARWRYSTWKGWPLVARWASWAAATCELREGL